jgi:ketosteroid isomerase-like protein
LAGQPVLESKKPAGQMGWLAGYSLRFTFDALSLHAIPASQIARQDNNMANLRANASRTENTSGMGVRQSIPFWGTGRRGKVAPADCFVFWEARMTNTNLIGRLVDCWNTGELDDIDRVLSADFVRYEPDMRKTTREGYKEIIRHYRETLTDFHTEAVDTIEQANKMVFRFRTTGKKDNAPVVFEGVNILRIEGDKIVENWVYFDATGVRGSLARAQGA